MGCRLRNHGAGSRPRPHAAARMLLAIVLAFTTLPGLPRGAIASRAEGSLHDGVYLSPTWGYSVRWYGEEWAIVSESSADRVDTLLLRDALGNAVGFEGRPSQETDAAVCVDDLVASFTANLQASDIATIEDEYGAAQSFRDPRRSYTLLIAAVPNGATRVDVIAYFDCAVLGPGQAMLVRTVLGPAASVAASYDHLDILDVVVPQAGGGSLRLGFREPGSLGQSLPLGVYMSFFPQQPIIFESAEGIELGAMTLVDGDARSRVVTIENTGNVPLIIDPRRFVVRNGSSETWAPGRPELSPTRADWEYESGLSGPRAIEPGGQATLLLEFPLDLKQFEETFSADPAFAGSIQPGTLLIYMDGSLDQGYVWLDCVDGCAGGASRPRLRLSR